MAVVVTGAAGFIGRTTVEVLLGAGYDVIGIDRRGPGVTAASYTHLTADLLSGEPAVAAALRAADAVIHLAGCPGVRDTGADITWRRHRDNVAATASVLDLVPAQTPLVVASSSSVYGGSVGGRPSAETDELRPKGGYATSKLHAETLCHERLLHGGIVAMARLFTVAGEGQRPDMALARWIEAARAGRPLQVYGSLDRTRDITDVRQAARALIALVERGICGPINVGTGVGHPLRELIDATAAAVGRPVFTSIVPAHPDEVSDTLADVRRLRAAIGFVPTTDLDELVRRQVAATLQPAEPEPGTSPVSGLAAVR